MMVRLTAPVVYQEHYYLQGSLLQVSPLEGGRLVGHKVAVPEPECSRRECSSRPVTDSAGSHSAIHPITH